MGGIMEWLGLGDLFSRSIGSGASPNPARPDVPEMGGASIPQSTSDMLGKTPDAQKAGLNNAMMQMLMASLLANPAVPPTAPGGGPAAPRPSSQAFQYTPMQGMAVGPRGRL